MVAVFRGFSVAAERVAKAMADARLRERLEMLYGPPMIRNPYAGCIMSDKVWCS